MFQISCAGWTLHNAVKVLPTFEERAVFEWQLSVPLISISKCFLAHQSA